MNVNWTFFGQVLSFAILVWFTTKFIFPPLMAAIEERQKKIAEGLTAADRAKKELADADARVADEIKKARVEAGAIVEKAHAHANSIVEKAKLDAIVEATKQKAMAAAKIESYAHQAREELRSKVGALAIAGAQKILGREIDGNAHKALIDQLVTEI